MKFVSIILRLAALVAAGVCVYAWLDSRGKISTASANLDKAGLNGVDLVEKSESAVALADAKKELDKKLVAKDKVNKDLEGKLSEANSDLESERTKTVQLSGDLSKRSGELRAANTSIASLKKQLSQKNTLIENLKKEIVAVKSNLTQESPKNDLKEKVADLEGKLAKAESELKETKTKLKILEQGEVIQVVETDPKTGEKVTKKIIKKPYVPKGDMATVLDFDADAKAVLINKNAKDGLQIQQKIVFLREGQLVAEAIVCDIYDNNAALLINRKVGIPETIEVGDLLEMSSPEALNAAAPAAEAPKPAEEPKA